MKIITSSRQKTGSSIEKKDVLLWPAEMHMCWTWTTKRHFSNVGIVELSKLAGGPRVAKCTDSYPVSTNDHKFNFRGQKINWLNENFKEQQNSFQTVFHFLSDFLNNLSTIKIWYI
jgi:hypothetical protein